MQESVKSLVHLDRYGQFPCGLATVVSTEGSSYRRTGARMVFGSNGARFGAISGGCLEEDLIIHLRAVIESGVPQTLVYDTTRENDLVWGVGLGCNGKLTLLLERLDQRPPALIFATAAADRRRVACVLATAFGGTDPSGHGTLFALDGNDARWEHPRTEAWRAPIVHAAREALFQRQSMTRSFPDLPSSPSIFFEYVPPTPHLLIVGAGDDAQPLARLASELGWRVTVADPRPAFATPERFPTARSVEVVQPADLAQRTTLDAHTFAVVMTHHYVHDRPFLAQLIDAPLAYLGLLGPKLRADRILGELQQEGRAIGPDLLARLHAPVGLDLGGDAPESVALSMLAEMQAVLHARDGSPLRQRTRPIHD